ncbi:hypothetical protein KNP414_05381 [Paenibacillus mucilaginosus KNP414]|uniref:Uncharacterized protein n=1 Tax=Paenibacillus mucilaginosus (strain KNP414) TaxID=1036673 RepID=F8FG85_PAEMK|nr:hypothetical protein KNP414_05381 [Paenibacillus mucilaginosus KNP414]
MIKLDYNNLFFVLIRCIGKDQPRLKGRPRMNLTAVNDELKRHVGHLTIYKA